MADLEVRDVCKQFATRGEALRVLDGVSLDLSRGENAAILGPSGSGKSTLLQIIGTLDSPTSGSVRLEGQDPFALDEPALASFRNSQIGFVFQDHHLLPQCSVLENVLIPALATGRAAAADVERARGLIERVGLAERAEHRPGELSGGERQRVAIARAMLRQPVLLLADEPTGNLDQSTAHSITELLLEVSRDEGNVLIVVTHSLELAAALDRRLQLERGKLQPE
ncbi:MAG: ABC transporter ATP-binding protein [Planctomycetales bacterium]|nr:ABC transporter ATP-binding protein [Planctomycetales bacterium]